MGLIEKLKGKNIYIDTNIFIYIFEDYHQYSELIRQLINVIGNKDVKCYTSEITLAEMLVLPFKNSDSKIVKQYTKTLNDIDFVELIPTNQEIYIKSAFFRATLGMKLPDAIHVASSAIANCDVFLTNDSGIKIPNNMELLLWK